MYHVLTKSSVKAFFIVCMTVPAVAVGCCSCFKDVAPRWCFIAMEGGKTWRHIDKTKMLKERLSPCSTFKIPLAVMGFDAGIFVDEHTPKWAPESIVDTWRPEWKEPCTPKRWLKYSCVWYSKRLTRQLGKTAFQNYVDAFSYGNRDLSGDPGKNNGLTQAWLSSSLKISPQEQIRFLQKLVAGRLPASARAQDLAKKSMDSEDLPNGWTVYSKTGAGFYNDSQGHEREIGWVVGWLEKGPRRLIFVNCHTLRPILACLRKEPLALRMKKGLRENLLKVIKRCEAAIK